jgi:hypothetical protein
MSEEDAVVQSIGSAGTRSYDAPEKILEKSKTAPKETKPATQAASEDKAVEDAPVASEATDNIATPPETGETQPAEEEVKPEDLLGLSPARDAETVEALREKYSASSREAHRLVEERKQLLKVLQDELGVEPVLTKNGIKIKVSDKALEKAASELDSSTLDDIWSKLPDADKELLDKDTFLKASKLVAQQVKAKRPDLPAQVEGQLLPAESVTETINGLAAEKLQSGKPRLPDFMDQEVQQTMIHLYNNPKFAPLNAFMNQSTETFRIGAELLYANAWRVIAPKRAMKVNANNDTKKQEDAKKGLPSVTKSSNGSQAVKGKANSVEDLINSIGKAKPR